MQDRVWKVYLEPSPETPVLKFHADFCTPLSDNRHVTHRRRAHRTHSLHLQHSEPRWRLGTYIAGNSTIFGTVLHYVSLRLLNVPAHRLADARVCLDDLGGTRASPQLAKFWLAVLRVIPWVAVLPMPPDVWLLPDWVPIAPWRWWAYARAIHLPMGYIWSKQWTYPQARKDPLITELREELLGLNDWGAVASWEDCRGSIGEGDNFHPISWVLWTIYLILDWIYLPFVRTSTVK